MDYVIECCKGLTVDEIEAAILASNKAPITTDARALAAYLKSKAGG